MNDVIMKEDIVQEKKTRYTNLHIIIIVLFFLIIFLVFLMMSQRESFIENESSVGQWFNSTYDHRKQLSCDNENEILYIYYHRNCTFNKNLNDVMKYCDGIIACDQRIGDKNNETE